jgi:hypothetical protein
MAAQLVTGACWARPAEGRGMCLCGQQQPQRHRLNFWSLFGVQSAPVVGLNTTGAYAWRRQGVSCCTTSMVLHLQAVGELRCDPCCMLSAAALWLLEPGLCFVRLHCVPQLGGP